MRKFYAAEMLIMQTVFAPRKAIINRAFYSARITSVKPNQVRSTAVGTNPLMVKNTL
jgi:hypothetical protein